MLDKTLKSTLKILKTPSDTANHNMQLDEKLLKELDESKEPILHLYGWKTPSITYGYFTQPEQVFNLKKAQENHFELARRPTGGGVVFHSWDYAFSFLLPSTNGHFSENTLENYQFVNHIVLHAVQRIIEEKNLTLIQEDFPLTHLQMKHFCMARPTKYDVLFQGRKVAGAAQRKTRAGYLHQGTISVAKPDEKMVKAVLLDQQVYEAMIEHSFYLCEKDQLEETRKEIEKALIYTFQEKFKGAMLI